MHSPKEGWSIALGSRLGSPEEIAKDTGLLLLRVRSGFRELRQAGSASGVYYNTPKEVHVQELVWEVFYPIEFEK